MSKEHDDVTLEIRNCRFAYRCSMTWNTLIATEKEDIRYCYECDRGVHLCNSNEEIAEAINKNWCVAIVTYDEAGNTDDDEKWPLGDISPIR